MVDVLVLGGGIAGLTAALRLSQRGMEVTLIEGSSQLGGLGATFEWRGKPFEKFYHTTTSTDTGLMRLIEDAGMVGQFDMRRTTMGMTMDGQHFPFNTPLDLLRFSPLPIHDRIRLGAGGLSLRALGRGKDLDKVSSEEWMRPIFGARNWERIWKPMFGMKFGGHMPPALYLYERLAREKNVAFRAYPKVGYRGLADGLGAAIERTGGRVVTGTPITKIRSDGEKVVLSSGESELEARYAVSTLPIPLLKAIAPQGGELGAAVSALPNLSYMGVINALFLTRKQVTGHYWAFVNDGDTEFQGRIEMSMLTGVDHFHGLHGTYVMKYLDRNDALFAESDAAIRARWTAQFLRLHPHLKGEVEAVFVFRTPFVEPVWPLGYLSMRPEPQITGSLFMATTAQSYPMVTSWNSATIVAERAVTAIDRVAA